MDENRTHRMVQLVVFFVLFTAVIILLLEPVLGVLWLLVCLLFIVLYGRKHPEVIEGEMNRIRGFFGGIKRKLFGSGKPPVDPLDLGFTPEYMLVCTDHNREQAFMIDRETCLIGRSKKCAICMSKEKTISKEHCRILYRKYSREYYIEDLHSRNGTFVGTHRLEPYTQVKLMENAELSIGGCIFKFVKK